MSRHPASERSIPRIARMLLDTGPAGVALLEGPEFVLSYVNASYQAIAPDRPMVGRPFARVWPEVAELILPLLEQVRRTGEPFEAKEWRLDLRDGRELEPAWFSVRFHAVPGRAGAPPAIAAHLVDRTAAVLARAREEELRSERERLGDVERAARSTELLAEAIPQLVWTSQASGEVDWVNRHWTEYTGLDPAASRVRAWEAVVHPDDAPRATARWALSVASGEPFEIEYRLRRADGVHRWHLARAAPLRSADGRILKWFGTCTDIDDQKRAQEQIHAARSRAEDAAHAAAARAAELDALQEQREDLLRAISHDLRTPLTVVAAQAQMLARKPAEPEVVLRRARAIRTSAARMATMIEDLVDVVRLESGQVAIEPRPVALAAFATELRDRLRGAVPVERLRLAVPEDLPHAWADPPRLERILVNLVTNALKYSPPEEEAVLSAERRDAVLRITVADRGPGIPPDEQARVFERFYRSPSAASRQEGLGLGLYITRLLVEAHGGTIALESAPGQGSAFHVHLPVREA